jgi:DNA-binding GntR family transcriptional regulator
MGAMALTHPYPSAPGAETLPHTIPYHLADRIKAGIIRWRYPPSSSLREAELAAEFGASRGPVREALRILELQGLVMHVPRRGFKVKAYTGDDLRQLYRLRAQLEGEVIAALADKDVGPLVAALKRAHARMRACAEAGDVEGYFAANVEFHQLMIDSTESSVLRTIMHQINAMSLPIRYRLLAAEFSGRGAYDYHDKIASALQARQFALARTLTCEHVTANLAPAIAVYTQALREHET